MANGLHHVMIGLPEAGKSTYLAALWHVVCSNDVDDALRLTRLEGDKTYLNKLREAWAEASAIGRTNPGKEEPHLSFLLKDEASDGEIEIRVPDLSGEAFEADWVERSMDDERAELLREASGALVFINPQNLRKEVLISQSEVAEAAAELGEGDDDSDDALDDSTSVGTNEWRADLAPTQIQLVDLLQVMLNLNSTRPLCLVVIVSAWDAIEDDVTPDEWVKVELPLLWQFLAANAKDATVTYFGISAQGGDLERDGERLKDIDNPSDRIEVVTAKRTSHDITQPLRWLMTETGT